MLMEMDEIFDVEESISTPERVTDDSESDSANKKSHKITELECVKISNQFPLRSSDKCSIQNDFAVIIETGVHILSFRPNLWSTTQDKSQRYAIQRAFIQTPSKFPLEDLPLDYQKLDREKFCLLYLNPRLRPNVDRLETPIRRVKQVDWGYVSGSHYQRSILGVLTNQGCLQLYSFTNRFKWTLFADISELWKQFCIKTWFSRGEDDFNSFMKAYKCMRITIFAWCNGVRLKNENDALLLCVSESGMLSFWTISENIPNETPVLIKTHELGPDIHTCLWCTTTNGERAFLVSGFTDGTVVLNVCTIDRELGNINFKGDLELWKEQDFSIAENMKIKVDKDSAVLVLSKEHWLLIFSLDSEFTVNRLSFDKRIAGLEIMDDFSVFVTLLNFKSFLVKPFEIGNKVAISNSFPTNVKNHRCSGVAFSRNKEFCVFSVNLAKFHDHLTFKEPWYLLLCSVNDQFSFENLLKTVVRSPIHQSFDRIENFRIHAQETGFVFDEHAISSIWNFMEEDDSQIWRNTLQLMHILMSGCKLSKNPDDLFFVELALSMCNFQFYRGKEKTERSEVENQFYFLFLKANYSKLRESLKEHELYKSLPFNMEDDELVGCDIKCELCLHEFNIHQHTNCVICEKGHKVLRCRYSFLPITSQPYNECSCCHAVMIRKSGLRRCVMCDNEL